MKNQESFSFRKRAKAFVYAWQGLKALIIYEHNARIHMVAAVVAVVAGILLRISALEWCAVVVCISMVVAAEALNSAIEALADKATLEFDPLIGRAKDLGACAVTVLALGSVAVGCLVFIPHIVSLFN